MRTSTTVCLVLALLGVSCTSLDFFGYADDAPLLVVDRPDGYESSAFGARVVATGSNDIDLMATSGGAGTQVVFYTLASQGAISDLASPDSFYPEKLKEVAASGAGGALAALPSWQSFDSEAGLKLLSGCLAVGEPSGSPPSVRVVCRAEDRQADRLSVPAISTEAKPPEAGFGLHVAAIRPALGGAFLLAAGGDAWVAVYSSGRSGDSTSAAYLAPGAASSRKMTRLAAGRASLALPWLEQDSPRFYVAAASTARDGSDDRVQLFVENGTVLEPLACVARPGEPGFGGVMVAGDLDADGDDELVISASRVDGRVERVYVYNVAALAAAGREDPSACLEDLAPVAILAAPGDFESTSCSEGCGFGAALAIGDLATDDVGAELVVGAPFAKSHGVAKAGAVYLWRGSQLATGVAAAPAAKVVDSASESRDALGSSVAVAPIAGRNELLIGVPGAGNVLIAFCTNLGEDIDQGGDVSKNAKGKLVSTRCRLK